MASRNGLNPKIRGLKGRGFGRALPAPFGWGNGIVGGGTGSITVPGMVGEVSPDKFSFEFWVKGVTFVGNQRFLGVWGPAPNYEGIFNTTAVSDGWNLGLFGQSVTQHCAPYQAGLNHYIFSFNNGFVTVYYNGLQSFSYNYTVFNKQIGTFRLLAGDNIFAGPAFIDPVDEFRYYENSFTAVQATTNYNSGIGNNPFETERIRIWYQFETFENLDFSPLQDGSDMRIGIRDMSGNNNHGLPTGLDTNSASPSYVLKPF